METKLPERILIDPYDVIAEVKNLIRFSEDETLNFSEKVLFLEPMIDDYFDVGTNVSIAISMFLKNMVHSMTEQEKERLKT
ncbi:MAG: hypothetical protein KAG14_04940 [Mycoplasmataceae bacterium]|nr:hypothetical protein [Mycoplasmataceae bacterium]